MSLKIGLIGYYGFEAYSDELIAKAIVDAYDERADIKWHVFPYHRTILPELDLIILGGGSLLGHPFPGLVGALKRCDTPFIILGTGFRAADAIQDLEYLWERASLIAIRGNITKRKLDSHGIDVSKIDAVGDSIFLMPPDEGRVDGDYIGSVVRPHVTRVSWMHDCLRRLSEIRTQRVNTFSFSQAQGDEGVVLPLKGAYQGIVNSSYWFGNRLHPFCVALINGIPALAVEIEFDKVADVCSTLGHPIMREGGDLMMSYRSSLVVKPRVNMEKIRQNLNKLVEMSLLI